MIKYWFNHTEQEKEHIEHLAQKHGLMVAYGPSEHDVTTISIEKGGVVITEDPQASNVVVLRESCTDLLYVIPVKDILNIRVFR
ncbi:hypothetical protein [Fusibacter tunisiensis]|uniref:Uncharacterized protein n=1 Tax=Fusibacter tunisiensis TaxID=1008308 RepID=A0ABS2MTY1_9FIRM|nr:hypothetical protein [Fusibacter tunisiensis]MBM7562727.1 hypothetical protein [Fusibacter tunisiensis]